MDYLFIIYNARLDQATNKPQLISQIRLFRDGQPVFTGKENALSFTNVADPKWLVSGGAIKLGTDLVPGEYVLQVIVKDMLAEVQVVTFVIDEMERQRAHQACSEVTTATL